MVMFWTLKIADRIPRQERLETTGKRILLSRKSNSRRRMLEMKRKILSSKLLLLFPPIDVVAAVNFPSSAAEGVTRLGVSL